MIKKDIQPEPFVFTSRDLVTNQAFIMDAGVGIGVLYEVLEDCTGFKDKSGFEQGNLTDYNKGDDK